MDDYAQSTDDRRRGPPPRPPHSKALRCFSMKASSDMGGRPPIVSLNARDAMPHGGRMIIETRNVDPSREPLPPEMNDIPSVRISVRDTGTGMSEEVAQAAIEPFFSTKETGKGSGLGLSQVYGLVRQFNGAMRIDTRLGEGTAVHLFLPQTDATLWGATREAAPVETKPRPITSAHILLVDDDQSVRDVTEAMLLDLGYSVTAAGSGQAGLEALAADSGFDLLMIDIVMPGLSGIDTVRRTREFRPDLKVLYMTGYSGGRVENRTGSAPPTRQTFPSFQSRNGSPGRPYRNHRTLMLTS
jgi:CheY-like chemotaxis protein